MLKKLFVGLLMVMPSAVLAQTVSFTLGYVGTQGTRENQMLNVTEFRATQPAGADIASVTFSQQTPSGLFVETANGIVGTLTITGVNGESVSIAANAQWQQKTGSALNAVGFIPSGPININTISDPDLLFVLNNVLVQIPNRDPIELNRDGTISGSQDPVNVADLNALLPLQPAGVSFSATPSTPLDLSAAEGGETASIPAVLTRAPTSNVTLTFASSPAGECTFNPSSVTFTPQNWNTPQAVTVTAFDDEDTEGNHTCVPVVTVTGDSAYAALSPLNAPTVRIADNDGARAIFAGGNGVTADLAASENGATATATLPVALDTAPTDPVTVTITDPTGQCSFSPNPITFDSENFAVYQGVAVTAVDDPAIEGTHACTPVLTFAGDALYDGLTEDGPTVTITDNDQAAQPLIQGPSGDAGDGTSEKIVDAGTTAVHQFTAENNAGDPVSGFWGKSDFDEGLFTIDRNTGALAFIDPPEFIPVPANLDPSLDPNVYQVNVTFYFGVSGSVTQLVTIRVRDTALAALNRNRDDIEQIIVDAEIAKLRGQQNALRAMTSSARDRLAGGACGGQDDEQQSTGSQEDEACRVDDTDLSVSSDETGLTVSGSNNRILTFDGYRRITNLNLSMTDSEDIRTLSFNGHFALETLHAENALYGVFAGISLNQSDVARGLDGGADSYGLSLGAYAVNELSENIFSEAYLSIGRSQNQLDLTDGNLDVAADYGTTELHAGWILSGLVERGDWDILPELGLQLSRSESSSIDITGTIPGDTASVTWEGLTASLARANLSADFRHYLDGRADDAWILNFKPGVVCERVDAITVTSGCGASAGLGLNRTSADGRHRFSAEAMVEEVEQIRRKAASLNYELRF